MNHKVWDTLWINGSIATMGDFAPFGLITDGALAILDNKIAWVGKKSDLKDKPERLANTVKDFKGKCMTPGLIDCHTHIVYAGNRYAEFEMKLQGLSYEEISRQGGGIRSTVRLTRLASEEELLEQSIKRVSALIAEGVNTIEIKSGYALDLAGELKILRVAKRIGEMFPIKVFKTFLGAHAIPQEFENRANDYIRLVCEEMIPAVAEQKLADFVDVFCEKIAFNLEQTEKVFSAAKKFQLGIKCHAEQLSHLGASILAAKYQALSVDHLEYLTEEGVTAIAKSGTVAVLLPGAYYFLREKKAPPIHLFRQYQVPIAIATDCNPGTSPICSLLLILNMACTLFGLTPEEALLGVTKNAAKSLGIEKTQGTLEVGKNANYVIWDIAHPGELTYQVGMNWLVDSQ